MRFLFGWFLRFVRLSSRCAGERGPAGRDLPSCGSASRFPAAGAIPGFLVSPELSGDGEPVRHSGRLPGEREKLVSVAGTADCPQNDLRKTGSDGIVRSTVAVSGTKKSSQSGYIVLRLASGGPKFLLRQGRCRRFPVVVPTAFYRRKRICRGRGAGPMSQDALSVAGRSVSCCLSCMPGSAGPCGSRRGDLPRSGYR